MAVIFVTSSLSCWLIINVPIPLIIRFHSASVPRVSFLTKFSHHIETSQLICRANQLTGFYTMGKLY